jgi:hypothetical protein
MSMSNAIFLFFNLSIGAASLTLIWWGLIFLSRLGRQIDQSCCL